MQHYSIAFMPPARQLVVVGQTKDRLADAIGWYSSRNSLAHITVIEFGAPASMMDDVTAYLEQFCNGVCTFPVLFNRIRPLSTALCFLPETQSRRKLSAVMTACSNGFPRYHDASDTPHISIGRRLSPEKLRSARQQFAQDPPYLAFLADGLYLRRFNEDRGQYDVIKKFGFHGKPPAAKLSCAQLQLF